MNDLNRALEERYVDGSPERESFRTRPPSSRLAERDDEEELVMQSSEQQHCCSGEQPHIAESIDMQDDEGYGSQRHFAIVSHSCGTSVERSLCSTRSRKRSVTAVCRVAVCLEALIQQYDCQVTPRVQ